MTGYKVMCEKIFISSMLTRPHSSRCLHGRNGTLGYQETPEVIRLLAQSRSRKACWYHSRHQYSLPWARCVSAPWRPGCLTQQILKASKPLARWQGKAHRLQEVGGKDGGVERVFCLENCAGYANGVQQRLLHCAWPGGQVARWRDVLSSATRVYQSNQSLL